MTPKTSPFSVFHLRPLPSGLRGAACYQCDRAQASWWVPTPDSTDEARACVCALCVLYELDLAPGARRLVEETLPRVEAARSEPFRRGPDQRLERVSDADDVLGVVVLTGRAASLSQLSEILRP